MAVILITGCSSGIGLEAALAFAQNGDDVVATMRDTRRAGALQERLDAAGTQASVRELDVTRSDTFQAVVADVAATAGPVDVLVNNAGIICPSAFEDLAEDDLRAVMETNFFGPALLTRAVLPGMRARGSGTVIMVSSLSGLVGLPGDSAYAASKFALEGATEALHHEVSRWGIRVSLVEPGSHATGLLSSAGKLPDNYPADSPYRPLMRHVLKGHAQGRSAARDPRHVAKLLVQIAESDEPKLRWPADETAERVLATVLRQTDAERQQFVQSVDGTGWWAKGECNRCDE